MSEVIHDSNGRELEVASLTTREQMRLMRACGPAADTQVYLINAIMAATVRGIDGVPVPFPRTPDEVDALADKVDGPGLSAVQKWLEARAAAAPSVETQRADAKN